MNWHPTAGCHLFVLFICARGTRSGEVYDYHCHLTEIIRIPWFACVVVTICVPLWPERDRTVRSIYLSVPSPTRNHDDVFSGILQNTACIVSHVYSSRTVRCFISSVCVSIGIFFDHAHDFVQILWNSPLPFFGFSRISFIVLPWVEFCMAYSFLIPWCM